MDSQIKRFRATRDRVVAVVILCGLACAALAQTPIHSGFSASGVLWRLPEIQGIKDPVERDRLIHLAGYKEAQLTHEAGGDMIRVCFAIEELLGWDVRRLNYPVRDVDLKPEDTTSRRMPIYQFPIKERIQRLDEIHAALTKNLETFAQDKNFAGKPIEWDWLDAYISGIEQYDSELQDPGQRVHMLLCLVSVPPRFILETPTTATLQFYGKGYDFKELWALNIQNQIAMVRKTIQRYVTQPRQTRGSTVPSEVVAFEVVNEPDYNWIPDELRIEHSLNPSVSPLDNYVTELHLQSIPETESIAKAYEPTSWGFEPQDMDWSGVPPAPKTSVVDFYWGRKFQRYVKCLAETVEHLSYAARDEAIKGGHPITIVSGAVTNNNIDYLMRMYEANPDVFKYVDAIGIHPYHWPRHDIWDTDFVSTQPLTGWEKVSPRVYAEQFDKRFDFLEVIARLTKMTDPKQSFGMAGKKLWVTEFGIPTKKLGKLNAPLKDYPIFIYGRGEPVPEGVHAIVWEDDWDKFLAQVNRKFLEQNNIGAFLIYTLREGATAQSNDDDVSNMALFTADGKPRMKEPTFGHLESFIRSLTLIPKQ